MEQQPTSLQPTKQDSTGRKCQTSICKNDTQGVEFTKTQHNIRISPDTVLYMHMHNKTLLIQTQLF